MNTCKSFFANVANSLLNITNTLGMKQQHNACLANCIFKPNAWFTFHVCFPASTQSATSLSNFVLLFTLIQFFKEKSTQMLATLYKLLVIATNALPSMRMACDNL